MTEGSKLAVTVDIEDWYHVPAVTGSSFSKFKNVDEFFEKWEGEYDYLTKPTYRTLDLLDELNIKATFFVVADIVDNYPGLVEEIADRGHEIGCHGLHHNCAINPETKEPMFTEDEYREIILEAKEKLEKATGQDIIGFRAPGAYIGGWVLDVLEDLGFKYDSSVAKNSLYNKTDSDLEGVGTAPYIPKRGTLVPGGERDLLELPWPYWKIGLWKIPAGGGPMLRFLGKWMISSGLKQSLIRGDTLLYVHPLDIAREDFPEVGNSGKRPMYWAFKGKVTEKRIRKILETWNKDCYKKLEYLYGKKNLIE
ncbi:MAG: polysaccharide deacetylase family protein [Thermoplasmatota archaeon]